MTFFFAQRNHLNGEKVKVYETCRKKLYQPFFFSKLVPKELKWLKPLIVNFTDRLMVKTLTADARFDPAGLRIRD